MSVVDSVLDNVTPTRLRRYRKVIVAVAGAITVFAGVYLDEDVAAQVAAAVSAVLVYVVPNTK